MEINERIWKAAPAGAQPLPDYALLYLAIMCQHERDWLAADAHLNGVNKDAYDALDAIETMLNQRKEP